jgi:hypothetical protein
MNLGQGAISYGARGPKISVPCAWVSVFTVRTSQGPPQLKLKDSVGV